jgi:predicted permease
MDTAADAAAKAQYDRIAAEARALPGVTTVGIGSVMPLRSSPVRFDVKAEGRALAVGEAMPSAEMRTADPDYFTAAGVPLLAGHVFATTDQANTEKVAVINQTLADALFHGEDPVGKRIAWTGDVLRFTPISGDWRRVIGVVGTTQDGGLDAKPVAVMFMPFAQIPAMSGVIVIRADQHAAALASAATRIVRRLAPTAPVGRVLTVSQIKDQSVAPRRLNAMLISLFGILAVLIAAVGIAGVLAFSVGARTNEIGIRMSLGARPGQVEWMILREGGVLVVAGLALGVAAAFLTGRLMSGLLFGIAPSDPVTFIGVAVMMAAIGIAACWIPALRAARVDPAITMRT